MAVQLTKINELLAERGKPLVTLEQLNDALDFAQGFYGVQARYLEANSPVPQLLIGIALLAAQAPFTQAASAAITSKEVSGNAGSIKTQYGDAPTDPYPVVGGLLRRFTTQAPKGISFGASVR